MNDIQALPTHHRTAPTGKLWLVISRKKGAGHGYNGDKDADGIDAPLADDLKKLRHDLRSCGNLKANMSRELDGGFGTSWNSGRDVRRTLRLIAQHSGIGSGGSQIYIGEVHKGIQTLKHRPYRCTMMLGPLQDLRDSNCAAERWRWGPSLGVDKLAALDSNANNEAVGCVRWVWGMWEKKEEKRFVGVQLDSCLV
ncbi:hypothetical protein B0H13DRAFT_1886191 [Mycena leptocephala]|nr:hypothetical protein B0H13DRAFT_1886191 [Mycena leptocephala]